MRGTIPGLREDREHRCLSVDASRAPQNQQDTVEEQVSRWKQEAGAMLGGVDLDEVLLDAVDGAVLDSRAPFLQTARAVVEGVRVQLNLELEQMGAGHKRADVYITAPDCVRAKIVAVDGRVVLLRSDAYKMFGVTGTMPVSVFRLRKEDLLFLIDLVSVLRASVSPQFRVVMTPNVRFETNPWGIPFVNRILNFTINDVPFAELPPLITVATSALVGEYFWKTPELTWGLVQPMPRDFSVAGAAIPQSAGALQTGLPLEWELYARFLKGQQ